MIYLSKDRHNRQTLTINLDVRDTHQPSPAAQFDVSDAALNHLTLTWIDMSTYRKEDLELGNERADEVW